MHSEFETWYRRQHPRLTGVVVALCGDRDVAEDAVDEAFARALDRWDRVRAMESPEAWTARVAINVMRRRMRRRSIERRLLTTPTPAAAVSTTGRYPEVWDAVRSLPERQRLAVVLRYLGDLSEASTAHAMGVTRGTVSASLVAARSRLAELLPEHQPTPTSTEEAHHG